MGAFRTNTLNDVVRVTGHCGTGKCCVSRRSISPVHGVGHLSSNNRLRGETAISMQTAYPHRTSRMVCSICQLEVEGGSPHAQSNLRSRRVSPGKYPSTVGDEVIKLYLTVYLLRPTLWALSTPLSTTFILRGARFGVGESSFKFSVQQLHEYLRESLTFAHYLQGSSGCEMQSPYSKPKHLPVQCHAVISRWPPLSPGPVRGP